MVKTLFFLTLTLNLLLAGLKVSSDMQLNPLNNGVKAPAPPASAAGSLAAQDGEKADDVPAAEKSHFDEHKHKYGIGCIVGTITLILALVFGLAVAVSFSVFSLYLTFIIFHQLN